MLLYLLYYTDFFYFTKQKWAKISTRGEKETKFKKQSRLLFDAFQNKNCKVNQDLQ